MAVENQDRLRWQLLAHQALGDFLAAAAIEDLPALTWTVASNGAMTGTVDLLSMNPADARTAFEAWASRLGAEVKERTDASGVVHLYGRFAWTQNYLVGGALRAELVPQADEDGAS